MEEQELKMIIRNETTSDIDAIREITIAAFKDCPYGNHTEQFIIEALRASNALTVSLVAEMENNVVGHIAFSPVTIADRGCDWYGMGPVSVLPAYQKRGIGKSLINEGLDRLRLAGAKGCVLVGDPGFYTRFGFRNPSGLVLEGVPRENFLALPFGDNTPQGAVVFHEAFGATG